MALQPDGRVILAGWRQFPSDRFCMIRYFTDLTTAVPVAQGSPDSTRLWPNPATDHVSLRVPADVAGPITVDVFDMRGVLVHRARTAATTNGGSRAITIDLNGLAPGCYTVAWSDGTHSGRGHAIRR
jgi:hypothetical protein